MSYKLGVSEGKVSEGKVLMSGVVGYSGAKPNTSQSYQLSAVSDQPIGGGSRF